MRSAFPALQSRDYRLFLSGQLISLVGTWMQTVAQSWLVYRLTGSAALLGLIGFASQIPVFLLSPLGGVVADRANRRRVLVITQVLALLQSATLAILAGTDHISVHHLILLNLVQGFINAFDIPARQAFVIEMVGSREHLLNAIALNSSMVNGARVAGPAVAGVVVAAVGEGWCFLINAISYVAVIGALAAMQVEPRRAHDAAVSAWESIVEGFQFGIRTAPVRALLLLLGLVSLMGMPYTVLMPVFADRVLHGGAHTYGLLLSMSGIGALAGAMSLTPARRPTKRCGPPAEPARQPAIVGRLWHTS